MRVANADGRAVLVVDDGIVDIATASGGALPTDAQLLYERWDDVRALADRVEGPEQPFELSALQAPVPRPRQVFAIGMNYAAHAAEAGVEAPEFPPTFTKFPTCLTGPDATVALPSVRRLGGRARRRDRFGGLRGRGRQGWSHVAGLTVGQDLSERIVQTRPPAPQFSLGKSFPGFGPTGPWVITPDELDDPDDLALGCTVNGEEVQKSRVGSDLRGRRAGPPPVVDHAAAARRPDLHRHPLRGRRHPHAAPVPGPRRRARLDHRGHRHDPHPPRRQERTMNVELELAYLGVEVADPTAFGTFLADVVGLVPGDTTTDGAPTWRNDDRAQRIIVHEGPANDAIFIGFEAVSAGAFDRAVERARTGETVTDGTAADLAARRVERLVRIEAPWGVPVEIVHGLATAGDAFASPRPGRVPHEGPGVRSRGVPHHRPRQRRPLRPRGDRPRAVGLDGDRPRRYPLTVRFYHCNLRHHSLAIGSLPIELLQKLHHVMLETVSQDNVGLAFDRAFKAGLPDRQRARQARQRQDVQLLRRHAGRLPARVRLRRADDRRAVDREPSLRPDQRVGPPAAPVAAPRKARAPMGSKQTRQTEQAPQTTFDRDDPPILGANPFVGLTREQVVASLAGSASASPSSRAPQPPPRWALSPSCCAWPSGAAMSPPPAATVASPAGVAAEPGVPSPHAGVPRRERRGTGSSTRSSSTPRAALEHISRCRCSPRRSPTNFLLTNPNAMAKAAQARGQSVVAGAEPRTTCVTTAACRRRSTRGPSPSAATSGPRQGTSCTAPRCSS